MFQLITIYYRRYMIGWNSVLQFPAVASLLNVGFDIGSVRSGLKVGHAKRKFNVQHYTEPSLEHLKRRCPQRN